ncbi:MAG TPA: hypothetical protein VK921_00090 [Anditalea sp.]|nr:hypothetical protein [Anditalea sp.]
MKWTYKIKNKLSVSLLMFGVIGIVLLLNFKNGQDAGELRKAMVSMFDDRLVVGGYILKMSDRLHDIHEVLENTHLSEEAQLAAAVKMLDEINVLNRLYAGTVLTEQESDYFSHFTELTTNINSQLITKDIDSIRGSISAALNDLQLLSDIQLIEGEKLMFKTTKLLNFGNITSQFELVVLIIIGLMIQILLFSSRTLDKNMDKDFSNMN